MPDLLIELFSEEIPARMQGMARETLKKLVTDGLVEAGLTYASAGAFSTPRRLTLAVEGLTAESRPVREERKGPNTGAPPAAIEGFLRSTGLTLEQLERRADKKGEVFFAVIEKPGRRAPEIVAEVLDAAIRNFPWPKSMRWGAGSLRWVRPLHSILCLLSDEAGHEVVPLTVEGITAGNTTEGHRFMGMGRFTVTGFDDYAAKLRRAKVMLDPAEREAAIWSGAQNLAFAAGMEVVEDRALLTEIAGLVEWPVPLMGRIAEDFLHLPPEVLQTSMKEHQKFFSVRNPKTGRIEGFVTVANIETPDHGATILKGNQKVLAARLSDARFFWENDLRVAKAGMGEWLDSFKAVTFHNEIGSQHERIGRIMRSSFQIAQHLELNAGLAQLAAERVKADLASSMVGEFPELQGIMGGYYSREAGLDPQIADACSQHYLPEGPSDPIPENEIARVVSLADKGDLLGAFWGIDQKPTGSKDPFALRRATLGIIRVLVEAKYRLPLESLWQDSLKHAMKKKIAVDQLLGKRPNADWLEADQSNFVAKSTDLLSFFHDRLKVFLKDQGIRHDVIDACLSMPGNDDLTLLVKRATALAETLKTEDGANLIQGFKRANNILTQAEAKDGVEYSFGPDPKFAEGPEETALFAALDAAEAKIGPAMAAEDFATAMQAMAALRAPIDAFFTAVQINSDNQVIRRNRLNLLHRIRTVCSGVADLTRLEG